MSLLGYLETTALEAQAIVFSDNFEAANWPTGKTGYDTNCTTGDLSTDGSNYAGGSSSKSFIRQYPNSDDAGPENCYANIIGAFGSMPTEFVVSYEVKFVGSHHWGDGQKMMRLCASGFDCSVDINLQLNGDGTTFTLEHFNNYGDSPDVCFENLGAAPTNDTWHRIAWRIKKNTAGNADGWIEVYYDGSLIGSRCANIHTSNTSATWVRDFWLGPGNYTSIGNPQPGNTIRVDNFIILDCSSDDCTTYATTGPEGGGGDTTPPSAPSSLTLSNVTANSIDLDWTGSTDDVAVSYYSIERCSGASCSNFAEIDTVNHPTVSYTDSTVSPSTAYSYRVRARDTSNNWSTTYSNTASDTTPAAQGPITNECNNMGAGWIWCDDFENANPLSDYYNYDSASGRFVKAAGIGVNGSEGVSASYLQGVQSAGGFLFTFGRNPVDSMVNNTTDYREIYTRIYVRTQVGWASPNSNSKFGRVWVFSADDWSQAMIAHLWTGSPANTTLLIDPASCVSGSTVQCVGYNDFDHLIFFGGTLGSTAIMAAANADTWYCVEHHVKLNTSGSSDGVQEYWVNGNLEAQDTGLNFTGTYTAYALNTIAIENYDNDGAPQDQTRYFDNFVVSTQRIGCGAATAQAATLRRRIQ